MTPAPLPPRKCLCLLLFACTCLTGVVCLAVPPPTWLYSPDGCLHGCSGAPGGRAERSGETGRQHGGPAGPAEALPPPSLMPELQRWAHDLGCNSAGSAPPEILPTPRGGPQAGGALAHLTALAASSSRRLDPLMQMLADGERAFKI
jgi:hypothetical protein